MKMSNELTKMISDHVNMEAGNSTAYASIYSWLYTNGWDGFAKKYLSDVSEEMEHAIKFVEYLGLREATTIIAPLKMKAMPKEIKMIISLILELEEQTEQSMRNILDKAVAENDGSATEFMSNMLSNQEKATKEARDFNTKIQECDVSALVILNSK